MLNNNHTLTRHIKIRSNFDIPIKISISNYRYSYKLPNETFTILPRTTYTFALNTNKHYLWVLPKDNIVNYISGFFIDPINNYYEIQHSKIVTYQMFEKFQTPLIK